MNNDDNLPVQLQKKLDYLKRQLQTQTTLTNNHERLSAEHDSTLFDMLPLIIQQIKNGVNLEVSHPTFYQHLLTNVILRQAFVDSLDAELRFETSGISSSQKTTRIANLNHLIMTPAKILLSAQGEWQATVEKRSVQIQNYFETQLMQLMLARSDHSIELAWQTLVKSDIKLQDALYSVLLDVKPRGLYFDLRLDVASDSLPFPPIVAKLGWGEYDTVVVVKESGLVMLPQVSAESVFAHATTSFTEDIRLTLTPLHDAEAPPP